MVTVVNFEGKKLPMCVAGLIGNVVLVCREDEFRAAEKERRQPRSVGFKKKWVHEISSHK
jgi:hypothetical protein